MKLLTELPNIGKTLAIKLNKAGILTEGDLKAVGSENAIIKIATIENNGVCINMLYAIEGAIQGIRWHGLDNERKSELRAFYNMMKIGDKYKWTMSYILITKLKNLRILKVE